MTLWRTCRNSGAQMLLRTMPQQHELTSTTCCVAHHCCTAQSTKSNIASPLPSCAFDISWSGDTDNSTGSILCVVAVVLLAFIDFVVCVSCARVPVVSEALLALSVERRNSNTRPFGTTSLCSHITSQKHYNSR